MRLCKLINARKVVTQCAGEKIPVQVAYKLMKFLKATDNDEIFYNEKMRQILNQYALKDEKGNFISSGDDGISLKPEIAESCQKEISELENTDVELTVKFSIEELDGLKLSIKDIFDLDGLIEES